MKKTTQTEKGLPIYKFNNGDLRTHIEKIVNNFKSDPDNYGDPEMMPSKDECYNGQEKSWILDVPNVEESYFYYNKEERDLDYKNLTQMLDLLLTPEPQTEVKHTPLPFWRDDDGFIASGSDDTYTTVADTNVNKLDIDEREANTDFIIRACNSHYTLLEALKKLTKTVNNYAFEGLTQLDAAVSNAQKAIKQAE